ncbi:MAG: hypothetical protein J5527_15015 [Treponema sp.]|nr:hypothetical protein [Treponema sp.]
MIMKKMGTLAVIAGIAVMLLAGCGNKDPEVIREEHKAESTDLIKFNNVKNAKYLATQWAPETKGRAARAGELDAEDTLLAVVEKTDDNGEVVKDESGEPILEEAEVLEVPTEELKLCDWCVPQPVREIYQCPYDVPEPEAMGVYTVFACYIDWWQYTDGTPAPGISMLMYVKPDGAVVDVLNVEGNVRYYCATWLKENDGEDYIQFDENGNIFVLAHDDTNDKFILFRYNPLNSQLNQFELDIKGSTKTEIRNFKITADGKWIFLNVMVDNKKNNVYAMSVSSGSKLISMYQYEAEDRPDETTWAVSSIGVNPLTNKVYWYVDEYSDPLRPKSGVYVAEKGTNGYSADKVTRHKTIGFYEIVNAAEKYIVTARDEKGNVIEKPVKDVPDANYEAFLAYLKSCCDYKGDVEFNLSYFKDKVIKNIAVDWEGKTIEDFNVSGLYAADSKGNALTDVDALKYLFENSYYDIYKDIVPDNFTDYKAGDSNWAWADRNLFHSVFRDFYNYYWNGQHDWIDDDGVIHHELSGAEQYKKAGYSLPVGEPSAEEPGFPLGIIMYKKGTTESAYVMDETYVKSAFGRRFNGMVLANDEGTWVLSDVWDGTMVNADKSKGNNKYAVAFQLTDKDGKFTCKQPGTLNGITFKPRWDADLQRESTDPWYKKPFAANSNGIAAISIDPTTRQQKTIYYHSNGVTKDLLENDPNKSQIASIYAFNLYEDALIYNAVKNNGGYLMVSIDLKTGKATKLPIEKKVESMLGL